MAKNLKITVKNAQLAEALKKLKKPSVTKVESEVKKEAAPKTSPVAEKQVLPPAAPLKKETPAPAMPAAPTLKTQPPSIQPPLEAQEGPAQHPPIQKTSFQPPSTSKPPLPSRPTNERPFEPRTSSSSDTRRFSGPPRHFRPTSSGPGSFAQRRPPYRPPRTDGPGAGGRPYSPSSGPSGSGPGGNQQQRFPRSFSPPSGAPRGAPRYPRPQAPRDFPVQKPFRGNEEPRKKASPYKEQDKTPTKKPTFSRQFDSRDKQGLRDENDEGWRRRKGRSIKNRFSAEEVVVRPKTLSVRLPITVKDLAVELKLKASQLLSNLFMKGVILTLNDYLDDETTVQLLGHDFECEITIDTSEERRLKITDRTIKQEIGQASQDKLILRSPVVAFMGHVDHGKTSLIDAIRKTNVVAKEAGAITQHIGAFKSHTPVGDITILDTPGHEAFSAMRARGAEVTDIIVLVIAGDEGIRAQTTEAIQQARVASVPIMVAINKCDKPNFNAENVYRQLAENELLPEVWGGQTITVNCSALTGEGIKTLLEMLALQSEVLELKADPTSRARGTVIESEMHKGMGSIATLLVQNGTLHVGDAVVFADHWGRVKTMQDEHGNSIEDAPPSTPVKITGLSGLPLAGSDFIVVKDDKEAREVSEKRAIQKKHVALQIKKGGLENLLQQQMQKQEKKIAPLILRADVQGSLEALKNSLENIASDKAGVNIVSSTVGEISESDIELANASKATIIGFHTQIEPRAEPLRKQLNVKVRLHDIIYHAVDDVKEIMTNLLDKVAQEHDVGEVLVKAIFKSSQMGTIAGCQVIEGTIKRSSHVRVMRSQEVIWKGTISSLKKVKEDVREVSKGQECGVLLQGFSDFKEGDTLQVYDVTYLTPEL